MPTTLQPDRRTMLKSLLCLSLASTVSGYAAEAEHGTLPARVEGELDIHHIDTGRGNCTLIVAPDGTTLMIDAGASASPAATTGEERPSEAFRPGEWQGRYAQRHAPNNRLDYFVATHIHPDHIGDVSDLTPQSSFGPFRLTGVTDVARTIPITTLIDRRFPAYGETPVPTAPYAENYLSYLRHRVDQGLTVSAAAVGSARQIKLLNSRERYPRFAVRMLAGNGTCWTGHEEETASNLLPAGSLTAEDKPGENFFSLALRLTYGRFSYFHGGDLNADTHDGRLPWLDMETPAVHAAGKTEVATADHHGYFDACGPEFVKVLDARAYIIQAWDVGHPAPAQLQRMLGAWSGRATHDVFATDMLPANELTNRRFTPLMKSRRGHVVVRVAAGGDSYKIYTLDSSIENGPITGSFGPYVCRT